MAKMNHESVASQIDRLQREYDYLSRDSQSKLKIIRSAVSGGTAPEEDQIREFKKSMTKLRDKYNHICALARERLSESELPPEGSPANDFLTAISEKNAAEMAAYIKKGSRGLKKILQ